MQKNTLGILHSYWKAHIKEGDVCVDATAGKGRDTLLLSKLSGETGKVFSFDIQEDAITQTKALLEKENQKAELILDSHSNMEQYIENETLDCIVFNFGRLPGGDTKIFTTKETSIVAIEQGLRLLKPDGFMTLALYYGGENGYEEKDAILQYLKTLNDRAFTVLSGDWTNRKNNPPMPLIIWKEKGE